jgi:Icc-related predicted phosphoesterase
MVETEGLPSSLDALLITGDLQGVVETPFGNQLLGIGLSTFYKDLASQGKVPCPSRTGVVLAGDLYSVPEGNKRGASGDVRDVWVSFLDQGFRWVAGVQGNHDRFGTAEEQDTFMQTENLHLLDCTLVKKNDLNIGGLGKIVGDPQKTGALYKEDYLEYLELTLGENPSLLILHESPQGDAEQPGKEALNEVLSKYKKELLVVCGHVYWSSPWFKMSEHVTVVNVDSRVLVLVNKERYDK